MGTALDDLGLDALGAEPEVPDAPSLAANEPDDADDAAPKLDTSETTPIPGAGLLLEEPSAKKIFRLLDKGVLRHERLAKNREEADKHFDRTRRGVPFSYLEKSEDRSVIKAALAPGVEDIEQPIPNKIDDLCTKIVSQILVDPFVPKAIPDGDSDRNRAAADLAKKWLRADGGVAGTNDTELLREALTTNITRSSVFTYVWCDPTGGGWRPMQYKAHPQATDPKNPLMGPKLDPQGAPVLDPLTKQPVMEKTTDPVLRFVAQVPDQEAETIGATGATKLVFTEDASAAARQWQPKFRRKLLLRSQIRTFPKSASIFEAQAVTVLMWETLREAKRRFKVLATMGDAQLKNLLTWKPKRWKAIVPEAMWPKGEDDSFSDDSLLFWYLHFCVQDPAYPDGAEVHVNGANDGFLLKRDTLRDDVEIEDGTSVPVLLPIPITQFLALQSLADKGDPQGRPPIEAFAGTNAFFAHLYTAILDVIDKGLNPNIYLSSTSPVTREEITRRDGTPIEILTGEDKPFYEQVPELPSFTMDVLKQLEMAMESQAQTNQTGNGLDSPYSVSGKAKEIAINHARMLLSQYWQNTVNGLTHYWWIKVRWAQAKLTVPQLVSLSGEQSAYKQKYFIGADLVGISTTTLQPGSGTMMTGPEKTQWLGTLQSNKWLTEEQAGELARNAMADDLGLEPDVHREHINRCITVWVDGPPKDVVDAMQAKTAYQAKVRDLTTLYQSQGIDPQTAQQRALQQAGQPPADAPVASPFEPRANDDDPLVAKTQAYALSHLMATPDYSKQPVFWRQLVDQKWATAFAAAGGVTIKQQAAAKQAAKGSPEQTYQDFVQGIVQKVLSLEATAMAKEIASLASGGGEAAQPGQPDAAAVATTAAETQAADVKHADTMATLTHESVEKEKDRQHESAENARDREASAAELSQKLHGDAVKEALRSTRPVPRASGAPSAGSGKPSH